MKIYIVGSVASGKSTLARRLSKAIGIKCTHLDGVVHIKDPSNKKWGNLRRTDEEIDKLFLDLISGDNWIIEDAGRKMFVEGLKRADIVLYLKPNVHTRRRRIITRYIKQKLGLEESLYTPNIRMLTSMFKWLNNYERGEDDLETRVFTYPDKVVVLRKKMEIDAYISELSLLVANKTQVMPS